MSMRNILFVLSCWCLVACQEQPEPTTSIVVDAANTEAREDSMALVAAYAGQSLIELSVTATVETASARATALADAADDPAIWIHPTEPAQSLVYGSNKTGGLAVYNLAGEEVDYYPIGNVNNVDILTNVPLGDERITLLGCSNRTEQSLNLFRINEATGALTNIAVGVLAVDSSKIDDVYGFCLGQIADEVYAFINGKNGRMQQFLLMDADSGRFAVQLVREVQFPSQTEGMVADNENGALYVGEEAAGIWKLPLAPAATVDQLKARGERIVSLEAQPNFTADVEGLSIYRGAANEHYLVASMQGNFSYAIFDLTADNQYLGSFKIVSDGIDGVEETDGLEVVSTPLPGYPGGLLVVQDGFNYQGDSLQPQNFKYVDFGSVLNLLKL